MTSKPRLRHSLIALGLIGGLCLPLATSAATANHHHVKEDPGSPVASSSVSADGSATDQSAAASASASSESASADTASADSASRAKAAKPDQPTTPTGKWERLLALAVAALVLGAAATLATGFKPWRFVIGEDGRVSNSKTQLATWSWLLGTVYLAMVGLRVAHLGLGYIGGVGITENLLALSGLSALTYGGAKAITMKKIDDANQPAAPGPGLVQPPPQKTRAARANLSDLVTNDNGQADLGDFQMIAITTIAAGTFLLTAFHVLGQLPSGLTATLPDIDTTLLTGLGVGQGAYLFKKGASNLGDG